MQSTKYEPDPVNYCVQKSPQIHNPEEYQQWQSTVITYFPPLPLFRFIPSPFPFHPPLPVIYGAQDVLETRIFTFCCRSFGISFMVPWIVKWGNPFFMTMSYFFSIFYLHLYSRYGSISRIFVDFFSIQGASNENQLEPEFQN